MMYLVNEVPWFGDVRSIGLIPGMLCAEDGRPAVEQLDCHYLHGGGWRKFEGFTLNRVDDLTAELQYPGDPPMKQLAVAVLHDERIHVFEYAWVCVVKADGTHEIARMD